MNIHRIYVDLSVAHKILMEEKEEKSFYIDLASYLTQQAIEKSLKYILHNVHGVDDTTRSFKTHNIAFLLDQIERIDPKFVENHQDLEFLADTVTGWEANARYTDCLCSTRTDVRVALRIADRLYEEVKTIEDARDAERAGNSAESSGSARQPEEDRAESGTLREEGETSCLQEEDGFGPRM